MWVGGCPTAPTPHPAPGWHIFLFYKIWGGWVSEIPSPPPLILTSALTPTLRLTWARGLHTGISNILEKNADKIRRQCENLPPISGRLKNIGYVNQFC